MTKTKSAMVWFVVVCCLAAVAGHASFADELATISGRITDPHGLVVAGVKVDAINVNTNVTYSGETNADGLYRIPSIPPGLYRVTVQKTGFAQILKPDVELHVQDLITLNFAMQLGSVNETVTVEGGAPLMNTQDATVSTVVDRQFAENLPMNGRTFQTLIELTPGVVLTTGSGEGQFSVNGQRSASNYWMVDGVSANIGISPFAKPGNGLGGSIGAFNVTGGTNGLVSVDAMQEFRVQTSTYAPEFGRSPGAQISIVTRSGANQVHGSAFDYFRNDVLDANDWFADATNLPKPADRQNDFGGTFSGPIRRDRTFFFFSYEGLRLRQPQVLLTAVPTSAARQNAIPAVQPFLNAYPLPNGPMSGTDQAQYNASFSNRVSLDAYSLRIDHKLANRVSLFGRYNHSPSEILQPGQTGPVSNVGRVSLTTKTGTAGVTWDASPTVSNDFRANYSSTSGTSTSYLDTTGGAIVPTTVMIQASNLLPSPYTTENGRGAFFILGMSHGTILLGRNFLNSQQQINVIDGLSLQRGRHSLKLGSDFRRLSPVYGPQAYSQSDIFFQVPNAEAGRLFSTQVSSSRQARALFHNLGVYAQDTWRISGRLAATYGLRWDVDFSPSTASGPSLLAVTGFNLSDLSQLALAPSGTPPFKTTYGNVAPRVGLAYQLSQNQRWQTVIRGGFGLFFDLATQEVGNMLSQTAFPFGAQTTTRGGSFPVSPQVAAPPPITAANLASRGSFLFAPNPNLEEPYTLQWNVALDQALGPQQTITASYVGALGRRLLTRQQVVAPNPSFANASLATNGATSDYEALQVQFQRRLLRGLQSLASYTWSHSIDTGSLGTYANGTVANLNANRGPSDFDVRNALSAGVTYSLPSPKSSVLANAFLRSWSVENLVLAQSAPPVDVFNAFVTQVLGSNSSVVIRPDLVPGIPLYLYGSQYPGGKAINNTVGAVAGGCSNGSQSIGPFCPPPTDPSTGLPTRQGNLGRNALRGFGLVEWDSAVHRAFAIRESISLQFRAEVFNIINHPNFAPPAADLANSNGPFGLSTQMLGRGLTGGLLGGGGLSPLYQVGGPRSIQLALKLMF